MRKAKESTISPELLEAMTGVCHCLSARKRARQITRIYDEKLSPYGLTIGQFGIMTMIASRGEVSVQELANALDLDQSALSRALGPLEREGLVESSADQSDGRRRVLSVTVNGLKKLSAAALGWKAAQDAVEADTGKQ
jgi:DNA-binding MarR family transcriptional regulator